MSSFTVESLLTICPDNVQRYIISTNLSFALKTDLSFAIKANLSFALNPYGFNGNSVSFIRSYLTNRYQRTKIGSTFSGWNKIITGVPQGSILEPLFFNIYIHDLFLFANKSEICNYDDDNTLYSANQMTLKP